MNKSAIEWTDRTWNPITGCLGTVARVRCPYCYANKLAQGRLRARYLANPHYAQGEDPSDPFVPRLWYDRLDDPLKLKAPSKIFVGSMTDLFAPWMPDAWKEQVLRVIEKCPQHTFQLLTKHPGYAMKHSPFPENVWFGATAITNGQMQTADDALSSIKATVKFISMEPFFNAVTWASWGGANWLILGGLSGCGSYEPYVPDVERVLRFADAKGVPVFIKDNLNWPEERREWPNIRKEQ